MHQEKVVQEYGHWLILQSFDGKYYGRRDSDPNSLMTSPQFTGELPEVDDVISVIDASGKK